MPIPFQIVDSINVAGNINNEICGEKIVDFIKSIPMYMEKSTLISPPAKEIKSTISAFIESYSLIYPDLENQDSSQIVCVKNKEKEQMDLTSMFIRLNKIGFEYQGVIKEIYFQEDSMEAIINFEHNEHELYFFDLDFVKNCRNYVSNNPVKAVIYGIAHDVELVDKNLTQTITINENIAPIFKKEVGETVDIIVGQMRCCFASADIIEDGYKIYEFHGKIHCVQAVELSLTETQGWICAVDLLWHGDNEPNENDLLEIYIPKHSWKENKEPAVDDYLSGIITLCGFVKI